MKKNIRRVMFCFAAGVLFFSGCAQKKTETASRPTVRLLTDATGIDDMSFNAAAWRGILEFYECGDFNERLKF